MCNLEAHLNTILRPLIWDVRPPTHHFVHKYCQTLLVCLCLGDNDPYYLDSTPFTTHCGVYQGTKPHIYHDPTDNKKTWVYKSDEEDDQCALHYLGGAPLVNNVHDTPINLVPELNADDGASPPRPPSHQQLLDLTSDDTDTDSAPDYNIALLLQDWDID